MERRPNPLDAISAAHDALASFGRSMARQRHHVASEQGDDTSSWRSMKSGGSIDQEWVTKLVTKNRALRAALTGIVTRETNTKVDLDTLVAAFYGATNTPGILGGDVCSHGRDDTSRAKKILAVASDLEVSRELVEEAAKAMVPLTKSNSVDRVRSALGMENVSVPARPSAWWDARHDLCLLQGVLEHGPLASEKVRETILEDSALKWPDLPRAPPPAWLNTAAAPAPSSDTKKAAKKPEKKLPHLPTRQKLQQRHEALVQAASGSSDDAPKKRKSGPRKKKEKGPVVAAPAPKRQKASASKPTGRPTVIDVDAPIPKKKSMLDFAKPKKKQTSLSSFFGAKKESKEAAPAAFPGWGRPVAEADPAADTASDAALARALTEEGSA